MSICQMDPPLSILTLAGYQNSPCGYCHPKTGASRPATSASIGMVSTAMNPRHYQALVDRGWRRSGNYYYKPDNRNTCCAQYTIRLDARAFEPRKDQRKAVNRWNKFVLGQTFLHKAAVLSPKSRSETRRRKNHFVLCSRVHEPEHSNLPHLYDRKNKQVIEPAHRFEVTLEPDQYTEEKYALFENYQRNVHREPPSEISRRGFQRFLCSGLKQQTLDDKNKPFGSYHHCYRLDGRLIAMGVLDLLPHCVSSVYLIYHSDFNDWEFGKISALREIALAIEKGYDLYYMGFYIQSCTKMRYKADFRPTYVLDPISLEWDLLDADLQKRIATRNFVSLSLDRSLSIPLEPEELEKVLTASSDSQAWSESISVGNIYYDTAMDYAKGTKPVDISEGSRSNVFKAGTPGVLSLAEVESEIDLDMWRIRIRQRVVHMEDIVSWHEGDMTDINSIKGIVAELAASIGPELVKETIVSVGF